jgi:hypothetical protein
VWSAQADILWSSLTAAALWRFVLDRFPVLEWLPKYTWGKFSYDLQAGVVVGCILIPQVLFVIYIHVHYIYTI